MFISASASRIIAQLVLIASPHRLAPPHPTRPVGFVLIMLGFLVQWPTILTLAMFPVLVWMYARLAKSEEADSRARFGEAWERYAENVPAFLPRFREVAAQ